MSFAFALPQARARSTLRSRLRAPRPSCSHWAARASPPHPTMHTHTSSAPLCLVAPCASRSSLLCAPAFAGYSDRRNDNASSLLPGHTARCQAASCILVGMERTRELLESCLQMPSRLRPARGRQQSQRNPRAGVSVRAPCGHGHGVLHGVESPPRSSPGPPHCHSQVL